MVFGVKVKLQYSHSAGQPSSPGLFSISALQLCSTDHISKERTYWAGLYFPKMATLVFLVPCALVELATCPSRDRVHFSFFPLTNRM